MMTDQQIKDLFLQYSDELVVNIAKDDLLHIQPITLKDLIRIIQLVQTGQLN